MNSYTGHTYCLWNKTHRGYTWKGNNSHISSEGTFPKLISVVAKIKQDNRVRQAFAEGGSIWEKTVGWWREQWDFRGYLGRVNIIWGDQTQKVTNFTTLNMSPWAKVPSLVERTTPEDEQGPYSMENALVMCIRLMGITSSSPSHTQPTKGLLQNLCAPTSTTKHTKKRTHKYVCQSPR